MQFTKYIKHITLLSFILLFFLPVIAQEDTEQDDETITDSVYTESKKKERNFKLFQFFKRKNKNDTTIERNNDEEITDGNLQKTKNKKGFFSFLKRKNKNDSIVNDSILTDSTINSADSVKSDLYSENKNDSVGGDGSSKPDKIRPGKWIKMNAEEQDSLLRAWDGYDKENYKKKKRYTFSKKEVEIALKRDRNFIEKLIYGRARNKPFKYRKKIITRQNSRYKKTLKYDRLNKSETNPSDSISDERRYQIVNKRFKREAKKEAIRKNKVLIKYDRKEDRLRRKYELSDNEKVILNRGKGMRLKGSEKAVFKRAINKQEKFTENLLELRKKRSYDLQSENVQQRMKKTNKMLKERDKERENRLNKKKKKKRDDKYDSHEFPKRYHK